MIKIETVALTSDNRVTGAGQFFFPVFLLFPLSLDHLGLDAARMNNE